MHPQCVLGIPTGWQMGKMFVLFNKHNVISRALMQGLMHLLWLYQSECSLARVQPGWSNIRDISHLQTRSQNVPKQRSTHKELAQPPGCLLSCYVSVRQID